MCKYAHLYRCSSPRGLPWLYSCYCCWRQLNANETHMALYDYLGEFNPDWRGASFKSRQQATSNRPIKKSTNSHTYTHTHCTHFHTHKHPPEGYSTNVQNRPWPSHALLLFNLNSRPCAIVKIRVYMNHVCLIFPSCCSCIKSQPLTRNLSALIGEWLLR